MTQRYERPDLVAALEARDLVLSTVRTLREVSEGRRTPDFDTNKVRSPLGLLPRADVLQRAFDALESDEASTPAITPLLRGTLYGVIRGGFASSTIRPALVAIQNLFGEAIGQMVFGWMIGKLERYKIDVRWIEHLDTKTAAEWTTRSIRARLLADLGLLVCDPENLELHACRRPYPGDTDYVTTITAAGDFPRTLTQLADVYDPRQWHGNPYAAYFVDVHAVTDFSGTVPQTRPEAIGQTWAEPSWILEHVTGPVSSFLINTLNIQFVVTSRWLRLTYELGLTTSSSAGISMERDFGYLTVDELPGQPGWNRVKLEKNVRFSATPGASGGDIGWGDLANLIAPDLVGNWLHDMRYMPCWTPS